MIVPIQYCTAALALVGFANANPIISKRAGSAGCGVSHGGGYFNNSGNGFPLGSRTYTVRIPPKYDSARAYPLIVAFHGHGGSSDQIHAISKWETFDTNGEYIVVYPQGVNNAWEGPSYADPTVDDLAFVDDLLTRFRNNYCIDNTRIYASGMSNGGGFVDLLACSSQGSNFAAFAMSSAALYADNLGAGPGDRACTPSRKQIPIMEIHGSADPVIPYNGGAVTGGTTPPILQWLNAWSTRTGATSKTVNFPSPAFGARVNVTQWRVPGDSHVLVHGIWIEGSGHCWAMKDAAAVVCQVPLYTTNMFLQFFEKWSLNGFRG